jgi:hypothetical protein
MVPSLPNSRASSSKEVREEIGMGTWVVLVMSCRDCMRREKHTARFGSCFGEEATRVSRDRRRLPR